MFKTHPTLYRYIFLEFMKVFALSVTSLIFVYIIVLFFDKLTVFPGR
jgi:hypothetical protein